MCGFVDFSHTMPSWTLTHRLDTWLKTEADLLHFKDAKSVQMWMDYYNADAEMVSILEWDGNKIVQDYFHNLAKQGGACKEVGGLSGYARDDYYQQNGKMTFSALKKNIIQVPTHGRYQAVIY